MVQRETQDVTRVDGYHLGFSSFVQNQGQTISFESVDVM